MSSKSNMPKDKYSMWSDRKIWECEKHPGCLVSIPCDCNNCEKYARLLEIRVKKNTQPKPSQVSDYLDCHLYHHQ